MICGAASASTSTVGIAAGMATCGVARTAGACAIWVPHVDWPRNSQSENTFNVWCCFHRSPQVFTSSYPISFSLNARLQFTLPACVVIHRMRLALCQAYYVVNLKSLRLQQKHVKSNANNFIKQITPSVVPIPPSIYRPLNRCLYNSS